MMLTSLQILPLIVTARRHGPFFRTMGVIVQRQPENDYRFLGLGKNAYRTTSRPSAALAASEAEAVGGSINSEVVRPAMAGFKPPLPC